MQSQGKAGPASGQGGQAGPMQQQGGQGQLQLQGGLTGAPGTGAQAVPGQQQQLPVPQPGLYPLQQQILFDSLSPAQQKMYKAAHPPQQQPQGPTANPLIPPNAQQGKSSHSAEFAAVLTALSRADLDDGQGLLVGCLYKL